MLQATGVTQSVVIQRACLDRTTKLLTVYYVPTSDGCGSFQKLVLYGRDNSSNPFVNLSEHSTIAATEITATLSNNKKWELYIAVLYACNGTDTLFSNSVFIDDTPPSYLEPDSISVDLFTQNVIAGWSKSPDPDVMGYSMFKVDPVSGNNMVIDEKNVLGYVFNGATFSSISTGNRLALAAYDSCLNGGIISNYHSPINLGPLTAQNTDYQCTKQIKMAWSAYVGWTTLTYDVFVKDNISNTWSLNANLPGSQLSYTFNIPVLGLSYSFYIRSHKASSTFTSSSNTIVFITQDFQKSSTLQINHVSVVNNNIINITGQYTLTPSLSKALLQVKNYGSSAWNTIAAYTPPTDKFSYNHTNRDVQNQKYAYRLVQFNNCNTPLDSSTIHTSILLRRSLQNCYWNDYWAWQNNSYTTDLTQKTIVGSTWNSLFTNPDSAHFLVDTSNALCYKTMSILYGSGNTPLDTAFSNTICIKVFDTTLIPNSFSPGGINPIFKITNPNILLGQTKMSIYNRWGQLVFQGDALIGWDGKDFKGEFVGPGFCPYLIELIRPEKREVFKGTIMILR